MLPLSQRLVSLVEVWLVPSKLVQRTVQPTPIVTSVGMKAKPCMRTSTVAGGQLVAVAVGVMVRVGVLVIVSVAVGVELGVRVMVLVMVGVRVEVLEGVSVMVGVL